MLDRSFHRRLVEASRDGIWALNLSGRTLYSNARVAELLGRSEAEMAEDRSVDVLDEAGQVQFRRHLADVVQGRTNDRGRRVLLPARRRQPRPPRGQRARAPR